MVQKRGVNRQRGVVKIEDELKVARLPPSFKQRSMPKTVSLKDLKKQNTKREKNIELRNVVPVGVEFTEFYLEYQKTIQGFSRAYSVDYNNKLQNTSTADPARDSVNTCGREREH